MEQIRIAHLIAKQLTERLTPSEQAELDRWLDTDRNKPLYRKLRDKHRLEISIQKRKAIDTKKAKEKYLKQVAPMPTLKMQLLRVAAIAVLVLSIGTVVYMITQSKSDNLSSDQIAQVTPGQSKASLILEDGSRIKLDKNGQQTLHQKGAIINNKAGKINYHKTGEKVTALKYNTLHVPRGGEYQITLPDGTRVWVNSETQLKYPVQFIGETRTVELSGEAYFAVSHNPEQPFIVKTENHSIQVLGTEFNIRAYKDDNIQHTTLVEGSINAGYWDTKGRKIEKKLIPDQQIQFNTKEEKVKLLTVDAYVYTAWKEGRFVYRNQSLETILKGMSRWYDIEIEFANQNAAEKTFSIDIHRDDPFEKVIKVLELTRAIKIETFGKKVVVKEIQK